MKKAFDIIDWIFFISVIIFYSLMIAMCALRIYEFNHHVQYEKLETYLAYANVYAMFFAFAIGVLFMIKFVRNYTPRLQY